MFHSTAMSRSFAFYLVGDVEIAKEEAESSFIVLYLALLLIPLTIFLISGVLALITKVKLFKTIAKFCFAIFTYGIIEQIFLSTIKYLQQTDDKTSPIEIDKSRSLSRVKDKIFTKTNSKRIQISAALLFPIQMYIVTLVMVDQLFILNHSTETCETYEEKLANNPLYANQCLIRPKSIPNISTAEFFNPANAFQPTIDPPNVHASSLCNNQSISPNETIFLNHTIQCTLYYFRWNNIINTLTNAIQWHQITIFLIKGILVFTFTWQETLGHSQSWSNISIITRIFILSSMTLLWATALLMYILIFVAFNKTLKKLQTILSYQTGAVLIIPIFVFPLLLYNTMALLCWLIRTIQKRKCEQEVSMKYDHYRNILIYANKDDKQNV